MRQCSDQLPVVSFLRTDDVYDVPTVCMLQNNCLYVAPPWFQAFYQASLGLCLLGEITFKAVKQNSSSDRAPDEASAQQSMCQPLQSNMGNITIIAVGSQQQRPHIWYSTNILVMAIYSKVKDELQQSVTTVCHLNLRYLKDCLDMCPCKFKHLQRSAYKGGTKMQMQDLHGCVAFIICFCVCTNPPE